MGRGGNGKRTGIEIRSGKSRIVFQLLLERYSRWIPGADGGAERDKLEVLIQGQRLAK